MRYKMDEFIRSEFEESKQKLMDSLRTRGDDIDKMVTELIIGYFELGFDEGCKASGIYSKELKELYRPVSSD